MKKLIQIFLLLVFLFGLNILINAQGVTVQPTDGSFGYDNGTGNGYGLDYEFSTPNPHTYLLQHVTAHIIYH